MNALPIRPAGLVSLLALLALGAALVLRGARPPAPLPATAPDTVFSAERAMRHVAAIAQRPHPSGSADNERVRRYVMDELRRLGLDPQIQEATGVGSRGPTAGRVRNVISRLPGRERAGRAVLLVSHYDGVAAGPAAADAGSGTAAILETVRALRAGGPLARDLIVLLTDGEEQGLLGAAAFVREHPWARDVGVVMNFEARGTEGRSFMFETGRGNLDVVRVLRRLPDVSATSLMVFVYRTLPNDTDLSELAALGTPALNFAMIDGVERYHTPHDDVAFLDPGSLQHHGQQALALARAFGSEPLPRPTTPDAVFFDVPLLGIVMYSEPVALALAGLAAVLVIVAVMRARTAEPRLGRDVALGVAGLSGSIVLSAVAGLATAHTILVLHDARAWEGAAMWRPIYGAAVAALAFAIAAGLWTAVRRRASARGAQLGALLVWAVLALAVTLLARGASYILVWPLLFAAAAAALPLRSAAGRASQWIAAVVATIIIVPLVHLFGVALGIQPPAVVMTALLVPLGVWMVGPHFESIAPARSWALPGAAAAVAVVLLIVGMATVRPSAASPTRVARTYVVDLDADSAWVELAPDVRRTMPAPRLDLPGPSAHIVSDSTRGAERHVTIRLSAPPGSLALAARTPGMQVRAAAVDGRPIPLASYRRRRPEWSLRYAAPSDSGALVSLVVPRGTPLRLVLSAESPGLPPQVSAALPARGAHEITVHQGDATVIRRTTTF